jgi:hypothetical protein
LHLKTHHSPAAPKATVRLLTLRLKSTFHSHEKCQCSKRRSTEEVQGGGTGSGASLVIVATFHPNRIGIGWAAKGVTPVRDEFAGAVVWFTVSWSKSGKNVTSDQ